MLRVETWKHGWRWVYSVTYDEVAPSLLEHALPLHRRHEMPGTVALDAARLAGGAGRRQDAGGGAEDDYLTLDEVRELCRHGWSVAGIGSGDRAPTRDAPTAAARDSGAAARDNWATTSDSDSRATTRVAPAAGELERLVGAPVTVLAVSTIDHYHGILPEEARAAGYLAIFTREDRLNHNHVDEDLYALGRSALYTVEGPVLPQRMYDPYWRLHQARDTEGWLVDCARFVAEDPADPERDVTPALLAERFEKIAEVGGVWRAAPDEVIDYLLMRRAAHPRALRASAEAITFTMEAPRVPERVRNRELTFTLDVPHTWRRPLVTADGAPVADATALDQDRIRFTLPVSDGQRLRVSDAGGA